MQVQTRIYSNTIASRSFFKIFYMITFKFPPLDVGVIHTESLGCNSSIASKGKLSMIRVDVHEAPAS